MPIKRILLPFCDAAGIEPMAEAAFIIGRLLPAQVRAFLAQQLYVTLPVNEDTTPPEQIRIAMERASKRRADKLVEARQVFEACAKRHPHVEAEFASAEGDVADLVSHAARLADISILGSGSRFAADGWEDVREPALFGSGRPILLIPPAGVDERHFERVVIAWKDSIEAARAIAAVLGAYSHWRWQERVFGGITTHVLREARMPVLMAH